MKLKFLFLIGLSVIFIVEIGCSEENPEPEDGSQGIDYDNTDESADYDDLFSIKVDVASRSGPDIDYKRGMTRRYTWPEGTFENTISNMVDANMGIFTGTRYPDDYDNFNDFYKEDGEYKTRQNDRYTAYRKKVQIEGLELFNQINGFPPCYPLDSSYNAVYYALENDYTPLPVEGEAMEKFQQNFIEWAVNADKELGENYRSTWMGTQEPTHTLGFKDTLYTDDGRRKNIRRFVDFWKPIAKGLRDAGCKVAGIQLPSAARRFYQYSVDYLKQQEVKLDYLTFQFYQWGDPKAFPEAIDALKSYREMYPNTELVVVRGHWYKPCCDKNIREAGTTSGGMIWYLKGEKLYMEHADLVYAHMHDNVKNDTDWLLWKIHNWLNDNQPVRQRPLSKLPNGVDGFATANGKKLQMALWNTSNNEYDFKISVENSGYPEDAKADVFKASGSEYSELSQVEWVHDKEVIAPLNLARDEILLITLE